MNDIDVYEVVKKLIGPIYPVGETNEDERRLVNLKSLLDLVECLCCDIQDVAREKDRVEYSIKEAGIKADSFLKSFRI